MEKLLNVRESADSLRVSRHTIRWWYYQGRLPGLKIGRRVLFKESTIAGIIQNGLPEGKFQSKKK